MVFNSVIYLLFLSVTAAAYYIFPDKFRWIWLLLISVVYYLSFIPVFFSLFATLIISNFVLAKFLSKTGERKRSLTLSLIIGFNILVLAFFKYFNFLFPDTHINLYNVDFFYRTDPVNRLILPLGLSYLIFTVISYQIELKRKTIPEEKHLGYFSLYLLFFPKIAQGPIERPQHLIPQLREKHPVDYDMIIEGLKLIIWGYFKKLVIADRLSIYVNAVFNNSENHNGSTLLVAAIFFAFQIYADFSGYTDIALGSARIFGFRLTNNFRRPYFATTIKEFWDRWHISFSSWLRDYVFLPFAFFLSNHMKKEKYLFLKTEKWIYFIAIMVTFIICGIWHGEGWTYIIWGCLFGIYLTYSNWTQSLQKKFRKKFHIDKKSGGYIFYKITITFILVTFAWIFFRAASLVTAFSIIEKIFTMPGQVYVGETQQFLYGIIGIMMLMILEFFQERSKPFLFSFTKKHWLIEQFSYSLLIVIILMIGVFDGGQFIYFQF